MFNPAYISELLSGNLSNEGYKHFIIIISRFARKYNWPNSIIDSKEENVAGFWSGENIKELAHQFFDWAISKGKFDYLYKVPNDYLSYYFCQILISFVANKIKSEQQKDGLSFSRCKDLVTSICNESYFIKNFKGIDYVYFDDFADEKFVNSSDILDISAYMPKIPIQKETKQFRPIIKSAIEDILTSAGSPISINVLIDTVYKLFDQHSFNFYSSEENNIIEENSITTRDNFDSIIEDILKDLNKADAQCIYACIFQNQEKLSLSEMAKKLDLPKSTLHHKVEAFKKKIVARYKPENEQVGSVFIQKLADALDKLVK
jgi:hypothetical protein